MKTLHPPAVDDEAEEMARQLDALRHRAHRAGKQVQRIREELLELIRGIDSHLAARPDHPEH